MNGYFLGIIALVRDLGVVGAGGGGQGRIETFLAPSS